MCAAPAEETITFLDEVSRFTDAGWWCECNEIIDWDTPHCQNCGEPHSARSWENREQLLRLGEVPTRCVRQLDEVELDYRMACCGEPYAQCLCDLNRISTVELAALVARFPNHVYAHGGDEECHSCAAFETSACPPLRAWAHAFCVEDTSLDPITFFGPDRVGCQFYVPDTHAQYPTGDDDDG